MAGDWIKLEINTFDKPEVMAITVAIGLDDPDYTVGKLAKMWRWFDQHTTNGNAENVTKSLLDRMVGVTGMCDAMAKVGWLIVTDNGIYLPNFDKHNGSSAKNRVETARRVAKHRDNNPVTKKTDRGIIPRPVRAAVMKAYSCTCVYCGRKEGEYAPPETSADAVMHVDHVVPLACGGEDSIANMVCACGACNRFKSDRTPDECGLVWPVDTEGNKIGVTNALPREEKIREDKDIGKTSQRGSRLPADWKPSDIEVQFCKTERPDLDPAKTADRFRDYWKAQPGAKGVKLDWTATWRNWVRNESATAKQQQPQKNQMAGVI